MMKSLLVLVVMLAIPAAADFDCDSHLPNWIQGRVR